MGEIPVLVDADQLVLAGFVEQEAVGRLPLLLAPCDLLQQGGEAEISAGRQAEPVEAWPQIPDDILGRPISKAERERVFGYGPEGMWSSTARPSWLGYSKNLVMSVSETSWQRPNR